MDRCRALLVALAAGLALTACSDPADPVSRMPQTASPSPPVTTGQSASPAPPSTSPSAAVAADDPLVVVTHATRPRLRLTSAEAADLVARRGSGGVVGSVRAVERHPGAIGVVGLSEVGPTVTAALVGGVDPVRDHDGATTLVVTGDAMLTRGVPDPAAALGPMRAFLRSADLTVGNLESTLSTDGRPQQGGDSFGGSPALVPVLEDAGYDALSLANNHTGDFGEQALLQTVRSLERSAVRPFGAGADLAEAARPAILRAGGTSFAFLGFNAIGETPMAGPDTSGALAVRMPPRTGPLVEADLARVAAAIRAAHHSADVVVVMPHWGTQYTHVPDTVERVVARRLVSAGADLVVGGHPHWVQGVDMVDGVPVLHSLGNFLFDMDFSAETMEGVVLRATYWGSELKALQLLPYRMDQRTFAPRRVPGRDILDGVWSTSTGPFAAG
ncbi:MAG TPA: CapA family protein [Nocardioides sp.]|uniref:CapA family protein n=1 Tax=Nocardioides sp. TaxID=35761 RepID=UPI002E2EC547|nr:CapA family protein [Nocardioides sp.]HEX5086731.1 CapA family protein [Nocardioides sp.]